MNGLLKEQIQKIIVRHTLIGWTTPLSRTTPFLRHLNSSAEQKPTALHIKLVSPKAFASDHWGKVSTLQLDKSGVLGDIPINWDFLIEQSKF